MEIGCPANEVEQQLKEAGEHLALPFSSTKDLLVLLDKIEQLLNFVGQSPSISMQGALVPSMEALVSNELIKHPDLDVKVSVASCLCEVARITAPEPPYKDEIMKDIFQLHVIAFGELSNMTGHRYYKSVHILESVALVKSCLLMLDMECEALVLEMLEQFLSKVRTNHPHTVFSAMETIMTLVIEESDEISPELLSLLISHVKIEKQDVSPICWKLAEKVLRNCSDTLKSYSETIMKIINLDPDVYADVVTLLCQNAYENELVTKSHKRDLNTLKNGGSTKKQKYTDEEIVEAISKKIDKNQLKGKEIETSRRGRPKKKNNNLIQEAIPNSVQNSQEDLRKTKFHNKSKGMKSSTGNPGKQSTKTKGNVKNSDSLYNLVIKKKNEVQSDYGAELLSQKMNGKVQSRRKPSFKKHVADGSHSKDNSKKPGEELVGHRIRVWWPLDQVYYMGVVSSYDPIHKKHKVVYPDGDEETLDLSQEKWMLPVDISSADQEQDADIQILVTPSTKGLKQKGKGEVDYSTMQEDNPSSQKSPTPADSSKTEPTREHDNKSANTSNMEVLCNVVNQKEDPVQKPDMPLNLTKKTIDNMDQDSVPNPCGELEEKRMVESSETTQILEKKCRPSF